MATYAQALETAKRDGCQVIADHVEAGQHVAYVWSPRSESVYRIRVYRDHAVCECKAAQAGRYCKHLATVRAAQLEAMSTAERTIYTAAIKTPAPVKASSAPAPVIRGVNDCQRKPFSIFK